MEDIRARVDAIVRDRDTTQKLRAWYCRLCKRPCVHDEYLQAFNEPGVRLIDTEGKGVERITATGIVVAGVEYEVDCIIYASGFEVGREFTQRAGFDLTGREGLKLSQAWADGMRSLHGIHVHGFPNAHLVQPTQGALLISNVPHNLAEAGRTIAVMVKHAPGDGDSEIEFTAVAHEAWVALPLKGMYSLLNSPDSTPGHYNNVGQPQPAARYSVGYHAGPSAYFKYLDAWRKSGLSSVWRSREAQWRSAVEATASRRRSVHCGRNPPEEKPEDRLKRRGRFCGRS
jgi:cyclohexanone monooxygenase